MIVDYLKQLKYKVVDITKIINKGNYLKFAVSLDEPNKSHIILLIRRCSTSDFVFRMNKNTSGNRTDIFLMNKDNYLMVSEKMNYKIIVRKFLQERSCIICMEDETDNNIMCDTCGTIICDTCYIEYDKLNCPCCRKDFITPY